MQVIIKDSSGLTKYSIDDSYTITQNASDITTTHPDIPKIGDLNSSNSTIYSGVTDVPADWCGDYYTYNGTRWIMSILNPLHASFQDIRYLDI